MIKTIDLENFKCFKNESINFGNLTVLTGLNGMGKSSLIQSLLLLRQSFENRLLASEVVKLSLNGPYTNIGKGRDLLFEFASDEQISVGLRQDNKITARWRFDYASDSDVLNGTVASEGNPFDAILFNDSFCYLQAERLGPRPSYDMSSFLVKEKRRIGTRGEYAAHFLHEFSEEEVRASSVRHPASQGNQLQYQVEGWLGEISPGTRVKVNVNSSLDAAELRYSFVTDKQTSNDYKSTNVGFGLTYSLPVIIASLIAKPTMLLVVENPEAHLHPKGQFKVGELLCRAAAAGAQVVVETHSDHIINALRLAVRGGIIAAEQVRVNFFRRSISRDSARIVVDSPRVTSDGALEYWPDGFFDEIEKRLSQLVLPS